MANVRFDWRWVAVIAFVAILANARSLPWYVTAATFAASGGYLLWLAWRAWGIGGWGGGARADTRNVTYWRGQRIETGGPSRRYRPRNWDELAPVAVYGLVGLALTLAALSLLLRALGM
jgi:hypothetical protein